MSEGTHAGGRAFDRSRAERDVHEVIYSMGIGDYACPCDIEGLAVYACKEFADTDGIQRALEDRGHSVVRVAEHAWEFVSPDGRRYDEDVIVVAFDVPGLPEHWRAAGLQRRP
jgi:hypothetical protein